MSQVLGQTVDKAADGKAPPASARDHDLHVTFFPPPPHNDGVQWQDFHIPFAAWEPLDNEAKLFYQVLKAAPNQISYIGANLAPQRARFNPPIETDYQVPLVLHNEGALVQIEYRHKGTLKWTRWTRIQLAHSYLQTSIQEAKTNTLSPTLKMSDVVAEEWEYVAAKNFTITHIDMGDPPSLCLDLVLECVQIKNTQKPLSFFGGRRVWAVRKCAVMIQNDLLTAQDSSTKTTDK